MENQVGEKVSMQAKQLSETGMKLGKQGWGIMRSLYANVATQVETVAKQNGLNVDLGAR